MYILTISYCQDSVGLAGDQKETVKATIMLCYGYVTLYAPTDIITSRLEGSVMRNIVPQFASVKVIQYITLVLTSK